MYSLSINKVQYTIRFNHLRVLDTIKDCKEAYTTYPYNHLISLKEFISSFFYPQFSKELISSMLETFIDCKYGQGKAPKNARPIATICSVEIYNPKDNTRELVFDKAIASPVDNFSYKIGRSISLGRVVKKYNLPKKLMSIV